MDLQEAFTAFERTPSLAAFAELADAYHACTDTQLKQDIFGQLYDRHYVPHRTQLQEHYESNCQALAVYPFFWDKQFTPFADLSFLLFPLPDGTYYLYDKAADRFVGQYDGTSRHKMRYFFQDLSQPLKVENEDNLYNLTFLFDNVRRSEDVAADNHIYLLYQSWQPLQQLMQVGNLTPLLEHTKFVFLVGKDNFERYPIDFAADFGIDYCKMPPQMLRIEEMQRIIFNQFYFYSGTLFFEGVLNGSDDVLVFNGIMAQKSAKELITICKDAFQKPHDPVEIAYFLNVFKYNTKLVMLPYKEKILELLPKIIGDRQELQVHELFKAFMIAAMYVSQEVEGKVYGRRIVPTIFFDPHTLDFYVYHELVKCFKYPIIATTVREPVTTIVRSISTFGMRVSLAGLRDRFASSYYHSKDIPQDLIEQGFYAVRFEDLKLKPVPTLHAVCKVFNIPYTDKLLSGKIGIWSIELINDKGEKLQGFDQRSVNRDLSNKITDADHERLNIFYWHILHYFGYPCASEPPQLTKEEAEQLFAEPFLFEKQYEAERNKVVASLDLLSTNSAQEMLDKARRKYGLSPEVIRTLLQQLMVKCTLQGFAPDLALPTIIWPESAAEEQAKD